MGHYTAGPESLPPREAWIEIRLHGSGRKKPVTSLPPREAWIEILSAVGMLPKAELSLPPREAWIEIENYVKEHWYNAGRFPRGKRGLKLSGFLARP